MSLDPRPDDSGQSETDFDVDPNPETRWDDPESDVPGIPTPDTDETDVDPETAATFWRSVLLTNVAVFGVAVGPMLVYFRGRVALGLAAVALGLLTGVRVYQHYRAFETRTDEGGGADTPAGSERNA